MDAKTDLPWWYGYSGYEGEPDFNGPCRFATREEADKRWGGNYDTAGPFVSKAAAARSMEDWATSEKPEPDPPAVIPVPRELAKALLDMAEREAVRVGVYAHAHREWDRINEARRVLGWPRVQPVDLPRLGHFTWPKGEWR